MADYRALQIKIQALPLTLWFFARTQGGLSQPFPQNS
jgi:hypothetical protein